MFYAKRIKKLEDKIDALEVQVKELLALTSRYCQDVDRLFLTYKKLEEARQMEVKQEAVKPAPRPRRRPRKNNGKENTKTGE